MLEEPTAPKKRVKKMRQIKKAVDSSELKQSTSKNSGRTVVEVIQTAPVVSLLQRKDLPLLLTTLAKNLSVPVTNTPAEVMQGNGLQMEENWNVVEALELLLDAGQYRVANLLANQVSDSLANTGRERLFSGYAILTNTLISGEVFDSVEKLRALLCSLRNNGHSVQDIARGALLLARSLVIAASTGCLSETAYCEARAILSTEFETTRRANHLDLCVQLGLEISKLHIHAPYQDAVSGTALLTCLKEISSATQESSVSPIKSELVFDLLRAETSSVLQNREKLLENLEQMAKLGGDISLALIKVLTLRTTTSLAESDLFAEEVDQAYEIFTEHGHLLGAYEIAHRRAGASMLLGHITRAQKWYRLAVQHSHSGGFLHGELSAELGLYQCALRIGDGSLALSLLDQIENKLISPSALGSVALAVSSGYQLLGKFVLSKVIARRCEIFFLQHGLRSSASQSIFAFGAAEAGIGNWRSAAKAWKKALQLDLGRGDLLAAADKQIAIAQAAAMGEFGINKTISETQMSSIEMLFVTADSLIARAPEDLDQTRMKAKALQSRAQLWLVAGKPLSALKFLSAAQSIHLQLGLQKETALNDAMSGLTLIEAAKQGASLLFEEAISSLERALQFFSTGESQALAWKLKYYLAMASYLTSQTKQSLAEHEHWRALAASWLVAALRDTDDLKRGKITSTSTSLELDFSPGLKPESLLGMQKALGVEIAPPVRTKKRSKADKSLLEKFDSSEFH